MSKLILFAIKSVSLCSRGAENSVACFTMLSVPCMCVAADQVLEMLQLGEPLVGRSLGFGTQSVQQTAFHSALCTRGGRLVLLCHSGAIPEIYIILKCICAAFCFTGKADITAFLTLVHWNETVS